MCDIVMDLANYSHSLNSSIFLQYSLKQFVMFNKQLWLNHINIKVKYVASYYNYLEQ